MNDCPRSRVNSNSRPTRAHSPPMRSWIVIVLLALTAQSSATTCNAGEYVVVTTCFKCAPGFWSNISAPPPPPNCSITPVGHKNNLNGSTAPIPCGAETYQNVTGQTSCPSCPGGLYAENTGSSACSTAPVCQPGTFANPIYCTACYYGQASSQPNQTVCDECVAGLYASTNKTACVSCPPGTISTDPFENGVCENCTVGKYKSIENSSTCEPCPTGRFSNVTGVSACSPCAAGLFQNVTESLYCVSPPAGAYVPATGASSPTLCPLGTFVPAPGSISTPVTVCQNATPGYFSGTTGQTAASACTPGTWSNGTGFTVCNNAYPGYYSSYHYSTSQVKCPVGRYANASGSTSCQLTPPGTFSASEGASVPSNCVPGYFSVALGSASCTPCGTGSISSSGATTCTDCDAGKFALTLSVCQTCNPGQFAAYPGQFSCSSCPPGRFADVAGLSVCNPCVAGKYQASWLSTSCVNCGAGFYSSANASAACDACGVGLSSSAGSTSCSATLAPTAAPTITTQSPTAQIPSAAGINAGPQEQIVRLESGSREMSIRASFRLVDGGSTPYPVGIELFDISQATERATTCSAPTGVSVTPLGRVHGNITSPIRIGFQVDGLRWTSTTRHIRTCIEGEWKPVNGSCYVSCKQQSLRTISTVGTVDFQEVGDQPGFTYQTGQIQFSEAVVGIGESTDASTRKCLAPFAGCECQYTNEGPEDRSRMTLLVVTALVYFVGMMIDPWGFGFRSTTSSGTGYMDLSSSDDGKDAGAFASVCRGYRVTLVLDVVAAIFVSATILSWPRSDADPSALLYSHGSKRDFAALGFGFILAYLIAQIFSVAGQINKDAGRRCGAVFAVTSGVGHAALFAGLFQLLSITGTRTEAVAAKWVAAGFGGAVAVVVFLCTIVRRPEIEPIVEVCHRLIAVLLHPTLIAVTACGIAASTYHACSDGPSPDASF